MGKSTLLMQVCAAAALNGASVAYVSGEEAVEQVRARAQRMGLGHAPVKLAAETALRDIVEALKREPFDLVVIDSVQTLWSDQLEAGPGSVSQVRAATGELVRLAKTRRIAVVLVGHVTKDGQIAGPRVVEHMVDAVLSFEGERGYPFRILRAAKNRFGATEEIGVFEMSDTGLREVKNPSALFLNEGGEGSAGAAVFARGGRVAPGAGGVPGPGGRRPPTERRAGRSSDGTPGGWPCCWRCWRRRCGLGFGDRDVYLNVARRVACPWSRRPTLAAGRSADLISPGSASCHRIASVFGEISLSGDVRAVGRAEQRLKEAAKLGFGRALAPGRRGGRSAAGGGGWRAWPDAVRTNWRR